MAAPPPDPANVYGTTPWPVRDQYTPTAWREAFPNYQHPDGLGGLAAVKRIAPPVPPDPPHPSIAALLRGVARLVLRGAVAAPRAAPGPGDAAAVGADADLDLGDLGIDPADAATSTVKLAEIRARVEGVVAVGTAISDTVVATFGAAKVSVENNTGTPHTTAVGAIESHLERYTAATEAGTAHKKADAAKSDAALTAADKAKAAGFVTASNTALESVQTKVDQIAKIVAETALVRATHLKKEIDTALGVVRDAATTATTAAGDGKPDAVEAVVDLRKRAAEQNEKIIDPVKKTIDEFKVETDKLADKAFKDDVKEDVRNQVELVAKVANDVKDYPANAKTALAAIDKALDDAVQNVATGILVAAGTARGTAKAALDKTATAGAVVGAALDAFNAAIVAVKLDGAKAALKEADEGLASADLKSTTVLPGVADAVKGVKKMRDHVVKTIQFAKDSGAKDVATDKATAELKKLQGVYVGKAKGVRRIGKDVAKVFDEVGRMSTYIKTELADQPHIEAIVEAVKGVAAERAKIATAEAGAKTAATETATVGGLAATAAPEKVLEALEKVTKNYETVKAAVTAVSAAREKAKGYAAISNTAYAAMHGDGGKGFKKLVHAVDADVLKDEVKKTVEYAEAVLKVVSKLEERAGVVVERDEKRVEAVKKGAAETQEALAKLSGLHQRFAAAVEAAGGHAKTIDELITAKKAKEAGDVLENQLKAGVTGNSGWGAEGEALAGAVVAVAGAVKVAYGEIVTGERKAAAKDNAEASKAAAATAPGIVAKIKESAAAAKKAVDESTAAVGKAVDAEHIAAVKVAVEAIKVAAEAIKAPTTAAGKAAGDLVKAVTDRDPEAYDKAAVAIGDAVGKVAAVAASADTANEELAKHPATALRTTEAKTAHTAAVAEAKTGMDAVTAAVAKAEAAAKAKTDNPRPAAPTPPTTPASPTVVPPPLPPPPPLPSPPPTGSGSGATGPSPTASTASTASAASAASTAAAAEAKINELKAAFGKLGLAAKKLVETAEGGGEDLVTKINTALGTGAEKKAEVVKKILDANGATRSSGVSDANAKAFTDLVASIDVMVKGVAGADYEEVGPDMVFDSAKHTTWQPLASDVKHLVVHVVVPGLKIGSKVDPLPIVAVKQAVSSADAATIAAARIEELKGVHGELHEIAKEIAAKAGYNGVGLHRGVHNLKADSRNPAGVRKVLVASGVKEDKAAVVDEALIKRFIEAVFKAGDIAKTVDKHGHLVPTADEKYNAALHTLTVAIDPSKAYTVVGTVVHGFTVDGTVQSKSLVVVKEAAATGTGAAPPPPPPADAKIDELKAAFEKLRAAAKKIVDAAGGKSGFNLHLKVSTAIGNGLSGRDATDSVLTGNSVEASTIPEADRKAFADAVVDADKKLEALPGAVYDDVKADAGYNPGLHRSWEVAVGDKPREVAYTVVRGVRAGSAADSKLLVKPVVALKPAAPALSEPTPVPLSTTASAPPPPPPPASGLSTLDGKELKDAAPDEAVGMLSGLLGTAASKSIKARDDAVAGMDKAYQAWRTAGEALGKVYTLDLAKTAIDAIGDNDPARGERLAKFATSISKGKPSNPAKGAFKTLVAAFKDVDEKRKLGRLEYITTKTGVAFDPTSHFNAVKPDDQDVKAGRSVVAVYFPGLAHGKKVVWQVRVQPKDGPAPAAAATATSAASATLGRAAAARPAAAAAAASARWLLTELASIKTFAQRAPQRPPSAYAAAICAMSAPDFDRVLTLAKATANQLRGKTRPDFAPRELSRLCAWYRVFDGRVLCPRIAVVADILRENVRLCR